ncbi:NlpC/P60 family protein [Streptomyces capoamus]
MGTAPSAAMGAGTTAPSVRGSGIAASPVAGAGMAPSPAMGSGTAAPSVTGAGIAPFPVTGAGMAPSPAMGSGTAAPSVTGAGIAPSPTRDAGTAASAGDTGVPATSPGTVARHARAPRSAPPVRNAGIAQPAGDTGIGRTGRETGPASPFGDTGASPLVQSVPDTAVAPPVHETGPVQPVPDTVIAAPARDTAVLPPLAHGGPGAVGREPAATSFTGAATATATPAPAAVSASAAVSVSASAMAVPQAAASAAGLTDTVANGPKAAKAAVQKKLAHARVLLKQQAMQAAAAPSGTYATKARKAIAFARAQLGKPCVWGAAGPGSYDCSGLTQAAWKSAGVTLPRTAREQAEAGTRIVPADARPGDLVFFHDDVSHVGLCTGDGMMIHAPRPGAYVREEPVSGFGDSAVRTVVRPG